MSDYRHYRTQQPFANLMMLEPPLGMNPWLEQQNSKRAALDYLHIPKFSVHIRSTSLKNKTLGLTKLQ